METFDLKATSFQIYIIVFASVFLFLQKKRKKNKAKIKIIKISLFCCVFGFFKLQLLMMQKLQLWWMYSSNFCLCYFGSKSSVVSVFIVYVEVLEVVVVVVDVDYHFINFIFKPYHSPQFPRLSLIIKFLFLQYRIQYRTVKLLLLSQSTTRINIK